MYRKIEIRKFVRFLKNNNVYRHYMSCVTNPKCNFEGNISTVKQAYDNLEAFLVNTKPQWFIGHAFFWEKTPQGHRFWGKINVKWLRYIGDGQKRNIGGIL